MNYDESHSDHYEQTAHHLNLDLWDYPDFPDFFSFLSCKSSNPGNPDSDIFSCLNLDLQNLRIFLILSTYWL